jgi:DMSO/TMAO reductase YedYZ molybdopterin-dependent catalytic subunit
LQIASGRDEHIVTENRTYRFYRKGDAFMKKKPASTMGVRRRDVLKLTPLLMLAGCDVSPSGRTESALRAVQRFNDWVQAKIFDPDRMAPEYSLAEVTPESGFRVNGKDDEPPEIDLTTWSLVVEGMVTRPGAYTMEQIRSLPRYVMNTRHCCVEGWSMIPRWGGTPLRDFLDLVGADKRARYLAVECGDDYSTSYDMPSARHRQTLLCYEAYDKPLTPDHGAPLRIVMPTKLGYKSAKWIQKLVVTDEKPGGYWEDQGYDWFAGI